LLTKQSQDNAHARESTKRTHTPLYFGNSAELELDYLFSSPETPKSGFQRDNRIPERLVRYPIPNKNDFAQTRYITLYEYESTSGEPTNLLLNGLPFLAPVTETPRQGTSELWHIINLTDDNHPIHIHLGLFFILKQTKLLKLEEFKSCMQKKNNTVGIQSSIRRGQMWQHALSYSPPWLLQWIVSACSLSSPIQYHFSRCQEKLMSEMRNPEK
jgi:FtsP/CotA-like multicopper oxidase with cupredoxin domain